MEVRPSGGSAGALPEVEVDDASSIGCAAQVSGGARPGVVRGGGDHVGAAGICLDIAQTDPEVGSFGHRAGVEAGLPEVACASFADVEGLSVAAVGASKKDGEGVLTAGDDDEVDVVGHEAVGEDAGAGILDVVADEAEVEGAVGGGKENSLAIRAPLRNMIGESRGDDSGVAWHRRDSVWKWEKISIGRVRVSLFRVTAQAVPISPISTSEAGAQGIAEAGQILPGMGATGFGVYGTAVESAATVSWAGIPTNAVVAFALGLARVSVGLIPGLWWKVQPAITTLFQYGVPIRK